MCTLLEAFTYVRTYCNIADDKWAEAITSVFRFHNDTNYLLQNMFSVLPVNSSNKDSDEKKLHINISFTLQTIN